MGENLRRLAAACAKRFDELTAQGVPVVKVPIEVEDLVSWCHEMGRPVDHDGRIAYVKNRIGQLNAGNIAKL